jgi:hypothetical protein
MEITIHVEAIQRDLAAAAALGGEEVGEAGRRLAEAVEPSLRLQLLDVLGQAALALGGQLPTGHVEVRLAGRDPDLVYVSDEPTGAEEPPAPGDDLSARITLRLPEALKGQIEAASAREGVSANAWIVRALARALEQRPSAQRRTGNRLQGYARG